MIMITKNYLEKNLVIMKSNLLVKNFIIILLYNFLIFNSSMLKLLKNLKLMVIIVYRMRL